MTKSIATFALPLACALAITGCSPAEPSDEGGEAASQGSPQDRFWAALSSHCGKAYAGEKASNDAVDSDFGGGGLTMHVRECSDQTIKVPFHVQGADGAWDRSRTWVFTRIGEGDEAGLRLKHDHRHEDGEPDAVTMYGGGTAEAGTGHSQSFPVDAESIAMFEREGLTASVTNVWTVEVDPAGSEGAIFAYQLKRTKAGGAPEDRFFRVEFDLTSPVEAPPAPWGHEDSDATE